MPSPTKLSKEDARRALVGYHFRPCDTVLEAFQRLLSVQFDPIAPVGCNHDLVLQARVPGYRIGDWETLAYTERRIYDGWDKQASLVPFEGWPLRRFFHQRYEHHFKTIFTDYSHAVTAVLKDLEERGPLLPKECGFQAKRDEWKGTWHSANVTKQVLRALWHTGQVMTAGRRKSQHLYDLTERVVPPQFYSAPVLDEAESIRELIHDRHRAVGLIRPNASPEMWSYSMVPAIRKVAIDALVDQERLIPVEIEGVKAHATPDFLQQLDLPAEEPKATFIAPLDQLIWDRKLIAQLFDFDYTWEIYTPEAKRRWGYYVLPILFGDKLVARVEFFARKGTLELRRWYFESPEPTPAFFDAFAIALARFMAYSSTASIAIDPSVDLRIRDIAEHISKKVKVGA